MRLLLRQIIERIIELNDSADRGQPAMNAAVAGSTTLHDESTFDTDMDDVFASVPPPSHHHHRHYQQQQQHLLSIGAPRPISGLAAANTSFDIRQSAAPPVQVRETTM